jgi:hypothetical protein
MKHLSSRRRFAAVMLVTAGTAALLTGAGITAASASPASSDTTVVEAFRETVKPWDSITIPSLSCPTGWLVDENLSPGRYVPKGVQVLEPGGVGATITAADHEYVTVDGLDGTKLQYRPITGTTNERGVSTATNWDAFSSHELVINLHCTTDIFKASQSAH